MATYKESGVDIELGDKCSAIAYEAAKNTFSSREGMIGRPLIDDGGFSGALDMGDYYLVQNDDGVGSKIKIAEKTGIYEGMGYDLIAMVADDAICMGAETISITNTLDVNKLDEEKVRGLMKGLEKAAKEQKIVIPGGEIAELGSMLNGYVWNATAVGILEKNKIITGENIRPGDKIIGLPSAGLRSNGFSLVNHILSKEFGENWTEQKFNEGKTWGEAALAPSIIYSDTLLEIHGRYNRPKKIEMKGVVHITGGGIPGNIKRILKKNGLGAEIGEPPNIPEVFVKLMAIGDVAPEEAYKTWNMGVAMILIAGEEETQKLLEFFGDKRINASVIGEVTESPEIKVGTMSF